MATKRNDDKGYERGAKGIDGRDGENFHTGRFSGGGSSASMGKVTGESGGPSGKRGWGEAQRSAKGK